MKIFLSKKREIYRKTSETNNNGYTHFHSYVTNVDNQTIYCGRPDNCIMEV